MELLVLKSKSPENLEPVSVKLYSGRECDVVKEIETRLLVKGKTSWGKEAGKGKITQGLDFLQRNNGKATESF